MGREECISGGSSVSPFFFLIILVVILTAGWTVFNATIFTEHARTSHVDDVSDIDQCFSGRGTLSSVFKMTNGRYSQYCNDGGRNNYWRIYECSNNNRIVISQFKQSLRQLKKYITNWGMAAEEIPC